MSRYHDPHGVEAACLESMTSKIKTSLWYNLSCKETKCFFPAHLQRLNIVGSLRDREVVGLRPSWLEFRILVCGGQCHLIHLAILSWFSWPSLAYMCTNVAWNPIHFYRDPQLQVGENCPYICLNWDQTFVIIDVYTLISFTVTVISSAYKTNEKRL